MEKVVVIRYAEIGLKGRNRREFEKTLMENVEKTTCWKLEWRWGRIYALIDWEDEDISVLGKIFGIQNYSPAYMTSHDVDEMKAAAEKLVIEEIDKGAKTFKVNAKRIDKSFPMGVYDINKEFGAFVLKRFSPKLKVDVHEPDFVLGIEIREGESLIFTEKINGPGGLPVGISGKAILLLSGGIDSPVAGWYALKRGLYLTALSFISPPYTDTESRKKIEDIVEVLNSYSGGRGMDLYFCPLTPVLEVISDRAPNKYWLVLQRRSMMRIATRLAKEIKASAIYTGESVGQVASQTIQNLGVIEAATDLPVLRPLCGFDKVEIVEKAKEIGTYDISIRPHLDVCAVFSPKKPATRSRLETILEIEKGIWKDLSEAEDRAYSSLELKKFGRR